MLCGYSHAHCFLFAHQTSTLYCAYLRALLVSGLAVICFRAWHPVGTVLLTGQRQRKRILDLPAGVMDLGIALVIGIHEFLARLQVIDVAEHSAYMQGADP